MSDKEMVLDLVQKLPEDSTLEQIYRELSFVAGVRAAEEQADRGELIDHARIREELQTWISR
jgi:predicted transcriptional regulator